MIGAPTKKEPALVLPLLRLTLAGWMMEGLTRACLVQLAMLLKRAPSMLPMMTKLLGPSSAVLHGRWTFGRSGRMAQLWAVEFQVFQPWCPRGLEQEKDMVAREDQKVRS